VLQLDFALERYGPDAKAGRELLRGLVMRARERFWGGKGPRPFRLDLYRGARRPSRDR
jgi:hypothetical protein